MGLLAPKQTLQSQYATATQRWLACERNYSTMLDRFKDECTELQQESALAQEKEEHDTSGIAKKLEDYYDQVDDEKVRASEMQLNADWTVVMGSIAFAHAPPLLLVYELAVDV